MPGYISENVTEEAAYKSAVGFDFTKVDVIDVTDAGVEYFPSLPTGSAVLSEQLDHNDTKIVFEQGTGLATTSVSGKLKIGDEEIEYSGNTGVGPGLTSGELTVKIRGSGGTTIGVHDPGAVITFLPPFARMSNRAVVIYRNEGDNTIWINQEDWSNDVNKSIPVEPGVPFVMAKSATVSDWIFCESGQTSTLRIINGW